MTTRTPAAIFEELLAAYEDRETARILETLPKDFTATQLKKQEDELDRHLDQVSAYWEEFREAMAASVIEKERIRGWVEARGDCAGNTVRSLQRELDRSASPEPPAEAGPEAPCSCCSDPTLADDEAFYSAPWCGVCGHRGAAHARPAPAESEPPSAQSVDLMQALKDSLRAAGAYPPREDERRDERGQRLAARHTREDGSPK